MLFGLTFIALVGISDPIRPEAYHTIETLINSDINVRLFTGDNVETAVSSGKACGILSREVKDDTVLEGEELEDLFDEKFIFRSKRSILTHYNN